MQFKRVLEAENPANAVQNKLILELVYYYAMAAIIRKLANNTNSPDARLYARTLIYDVTQEYNTRKTQLLRHNIQTMISNDIPITTDLIITFFLMNERTVNAYQDARKVKFVGRGVDFFARSGIISDSLYTKEVFDLFTFDAVLRCFSIYTADPDGNRLVASNDAKYGINTRTDILKIDYYGLFTSLPPEEDAEDDKSSVYGFYQQFLNDAKYYKQVFTENVAHSLNENSWQYNSGNTFRYYLNYIRLRRYAVELAKAAGAKQLGRVEMFSRMKFPVFKRGEIIPQVPGLKDRHIFFYNRGDNGIVAVYEYIPGTAYSITVFEENGDDESYTLQTKFSSSNETPAEALYVVDKLYKQKDISRETMVSIARFIKDRGPQLDTK